MIPILMLLVIATAFFTFMVMHEKSQIAEILDGNPNINHGAGLTKLRGEELTEKRKLKASNETLALLRREINREDLTLNQYRYYMSGPNVLFSIATADEPASDKVNPSVFDVVRENVARNAKGLDGLQQEHDSDARQKFPKLDESVNKRRDELNAVLKKINDQDAQLQEDTKRLSDQTDLLNKSQAAAEKVNREEKSRRDTQIGQLEDKIRHLLEIELHWLKDLDPEGQILEVTPDSPHVVINLGSSDHVVPGLVFEVFQYDHGRYLEKGLIEVVQTQPQISTCRVLNVIDPKRSPLSKDDYIGNPVFSTSRPKVFVVSGEFKTHNREDLENFIRQTGGIVRDSLSPGVDYLVAGKGSEHVQQNARDYLIQAMTEDQLLKYVTHNYKPK
jgi:hypothetical protein